MKNSPPLPHTASENPPPSPPLPRRLQPPNDPPPLRRLGSGPTSPAVSRSPPTNTFASELDVFESLEDCFGPRHGDQIPDNMELDEVLENESTMSGFSVDSKNLLQVGLSFHPSPIQKILPNEVEQETLPSNHLPHSQEDTTPPATVRNSNSVCKFETDPLDMDILSDCLTENLMEPCMSKRLERKGHGGLFTYFKHISKKPRLNTPSQESNSSESSSSRIRTRKKSRKKTVAKKKQSSKRCPTSQYTGVCWNKSNKKWQAQVYIPRSSKTSKARYKYLGLFSEEKAAAKAYDSNMVEQNPSIKPNRLNFPDEAFSSHRVES